VPYRIKDWSRYFENDRSRQRDRCSFVCVPNKQHGIGLARILSLPDGGAIYGVWCLLLGACSQQKTPRSGWLTDDGTGTGTPWTAHDLHLKFRRPEPEIKRALEVLCGANVGWMEEATAQSPVSNVSVTVRSRSDDVVEACGATDASERSAAVCPTPAAATQSTMVAFDSLKNRLSSLYMGGGTASRRWSNYEESMLAEICRQPTASTELDTILAYRAALAPADRAFFPQSVTKLLEKWDELLDRSRILPPRPAGAADKDFEKLARSIKNL
jgi:hypothetical protein